MLARTNCRDRHGPKPPLNIQPLCCNAARETGPSPRSRMLGFSELTICGLCGLLPANVLLVRQSLLFAALLTLRCTKFCRTVMCGCDVPMIPDQLVRCEANQHSLPGSILTGTATYTTTVIHCLQGQRCARRNTVTRSAAVATICGSS